jgi:O-antigen biosynthesis protein
LIFTLKDKKESDLATYYNVTGFYLINVRGERIFVKERIESFWKFFKAYVKQNFRFNYKYPKIDIIIPVYNNASYLRECINSAINQSYQNIYVTIVDDKSTDSEIYNILSEFQNNDRVSIYYHDENMGISAATNDGIIHSKGDYIAFLDCDDVLLPESIERVVNFAIDNPEIGFIYTNRIHINSAGEVIEQVSYENRSTDAKNELLVNMYTSHLKLIKRDSFLKTGLFSSRYDFAQDYDIALKISEHVRFGFVNEFLYKHRIHENQTTIVAMKQQVHLAEQSKLEAIKRRALYKGITDKLTSVVIQPKNEVKHIKRSIKALYANTCLPFELIILDKGSIDSQMEKYLEDLCKKKSNVAILFEDKTSGYLSSMKKVTTYVKGDYIVTLDNDICVTPNWLENFILRIDADEKIAATCGKVISPDGKVHCNGGRMDIKGSFISLVPIDVDKDRLDYSTLIERDCNWIPSGAMIIKRKYFEMLNHRMEMQSPYEYIDYSLQLKKLGVRIVNCPLTELIRCNFGSGISTTKYKKYLSEEYDKERLINSLTAFYKFNQLIVKDEKLFKILSISNKTDVEIVDLIIKQVDTNLDGNLSVNKPLSSA